jgi:tRNA1(Val) A37 N6-methylase TrmN6
MSSKPFVSYLKKEDILSAKDFALKHDLVFSSPREIRISKFPKLVIWIDKNNISLQDLDEKNSKPFALSFDSLIEDNKSKNLLHKCFSKFDKNNHVVDLTGGFCQDAFLISEMGFKVTALERESWLYDFTKRSLEINKTSKVNFLNANSLKSIDLIKDSEIIYLDPMFEISNKSSAKKEIQFLRKTLEMDDERSLFNAAWNSPAKIIVVKRHKLSKEIYEKKPSYELKGKVITIQVFDRRGLFKANV